MAAPSSSTVSTKRKPGSWVADALAPPSQVFFGDVSIEIWVLPPHPNTASETKFLLRWTHQRGLMRREKTITSPSLLPSQKLILPPLLFQDLVEPTLEAQNGPPASLWVSVPHLIVFIASLFMVPLLSPFHSRGPNCWKLFSSGGCGDAVTGCGTHHCEGWGDRTAHLSLPIMHHPPWARESSALSAVSSSPGLQTARRAVNLRSQKLSETSPGSPL